MENVLENKRTVPCAALVGCGNIGSLYDEKSPARFPLTHASAYLGNKGVRLSAACDQSEVRLREFGQARGLSKLYSRFEDLFAQEQIDILSICTPPDNRLVIVKAALESGIRHIICEKPLAMAHAEAKAIVELGEKYGARINVNFIRRWNTGIEKLKKYFAASPDLEIQAVVIYYEKGCLNNGSHALDLVNYFWGSDIKLLLKRKIQDDRLHTGDPSITASFQVLRHGKPIDIQMIAVDYRLFSIFEFDILHSQGRIKISEAGDRVAMYKVVPDQDCPEYPVLTLDQDLSGLTAGSFPNLIQNTLDVFHGKGELRCSARDAFETLKMVEAVRG